MKKLTLFLVAMLFSTLSFAALNPYAYGLSSELSADKTTLTVNYSLNADATNVDFVLLDGETVLKTVNLNTKGLVKGSYSAEISTEGLDFGRTFAWKIEVKGAAVAAATAVKTYRFFHPSGIDIDNNPESKHFGRILCLEANHSVKTTTSTSGYLGKGYGAGVYAFDAAFDKITNGSDPGFNGGNTFTTTHYAVRRVRISDDGRIFVTAQNNGGCFLWEIDPDNLNSWTKVFKGTEGTYTTTTADGKFIAGTNSGFDVHGSGENLKLLMLSASVSGGNSATFRCDEYDLGTAKTWSTVPSRTISGANYHIVTNQSNVQYDKDGGVWHIQYRGTCTDALPGLVHINTNGVEDYKWLRHYTRNAGFCFNKDYTKVIVAGKFQNGTGTQKYATIYAVSKDVNGKPVFTEELVVNMTNIGYALNDFAWDWADNIYAVDNNGEYLCAYALPHDADKVVSTPCPSKYAFSLPAPPQLNPFAYKLSSELSADEKTLTINYSLNALATSVNWVLMDGETPIKTVDLSSLGLAKDDYTTTISTTDFPQYKQLTWKIEVKGVAVSEPTHVKAVNFYRPFGVDIDNNPENPHFGRILCGETYTTSNTNYESCGVGAGIYEYSPAFELKLNGTKPGYNGGKTFTEHSPYRVRISEDGRIFVTAHDKAGDFLWEVNPENLNEWTSVFKGASHNADKLLDASGKFIAGTNAGFDVRGKGENLQLLMLSCNNLGTSSATFQCHEYNLGTAKEWSTVPTKAFNGCQLHNSMIARYSQVTYDNEGGFWCTYYINTTILGGIAHFTKEGTKDYEKHGIMLRAGACVFNHDFSKLLLCGDINVTTNTPGYAVIYNVSKDANGKPVLTKETTINTGDVVGGNLNDFAWDYANNIYAIGNNGEKLSAYALPHSSEDVVATPAASKYAFSIGKYTVTVNTNDENKGTVSGAGEYLPGATATLTATPKEGYELLYWSDRSKENPRNITVDGNEALSAYFIKKNDVEPTFSITKVWENTNVPDSYTKGYQAAGWDGKIYVKDRWGASINVYTETGSELYVTTDALTASTDHRGDQALAIDDAGNIIIRSGSGEFFNNPTQITIYKKDEKIGKVIDFTLLETGRCDFISASGDIYSAEGGYVYFYCNTKTVVNRLKIANGTVTDIDIVGGDIPVGGTQDHVIKDIFGNLVVHSRLNGIKALNVITNEASNFFILPNTLKTNTLGGCSFELSGKELWAYNVGTTAYTSEWNLYNVTDKANISNEVLYVKNQTSVGIAANWLNVQVVDEKTAYIYQFCPQVGAAVWKVTRDHIVNATAVNGTVTGAGTYKDNATATLTAIANDGYLFKNWTKNGVVESTENPYSFTVTEDVELVANFDGPFCELILNTNDEEKGTVSGAGFYNVGQTVTIKATPKAGYKLLYWSDRSTQNPRTITMNKKEALSAYFVKVYDEEPTFAIEKVWENTQVPGSADGYQAVGWEGNIYMQNKTAGKIKVYTNDTDAAVDYATSNTSGQQIAVDEAGNLIVFNAYFATATPSAIQIYKNGSTTGTAISFTLPHPERCDFISASGDIYSAEGGYVYFYCKDKHAVNRVKITNGELASVDAIGNTANPATSTSHVMVDIFGNLAAHCRSTAVYAINSYTGETTTFNTSLSGIKLSTLGGCSFELGGKELWAYNVGTTHYNSEWNLYNMTDGEFLSDETLYAKDRTSKKATGPANWLNVQVVDEKTAYIYQFCPEVAVAVWKVTLVETVVIDDKADNTTALAEYNGQKVTAKVTRAFNNDSYKTLTLPFDMDEEQIKAVFGETAIVHEFTSVGEANDMFYLHFDPTTTIEAGKPYIIQLPKPGEGDYDAKDGFTIENVTIKTDLHSVQPAEGAITMQPVLDGGGRLTQASEYWLASDNYLYSAGAHPTALLGLRAYFINSTGRPIRARVVYGENEATSIPTIVAPEDDVRKVLKDGQIIIIRGEKQYNIQGQVIE